MPDANTLKIKAFFWSCQGEGLQSGRGAVFIRFSGCSLRCPWCDTREAWEPGRSLPVSEVIRSVEDLARQYPPSWIILTGGEPLEQAPRSLQLLVKDLKFRGYMVAIETNGMHYQELSLDWWTVSPKGKNRFGIHSNLLPLVNEIKLVAEPALTVEVIGRIRSQIPPAIPIFLQPSSQKSKDLLHTFGFFQQVQKQGLGEIRLGFQLHKVYNVP